MPPVSTTSAARNVFAPVWGPDCALFVLGGGAGQPATPKRARERPAQSLACHRLVIGTLLFLHLVNGVASYVQGGLADGFGQGWVRMDVGHKLFDRGLQL